jgi:hypothetical protein
LSGLFFPMLMIKYIAQQSYSHMQFMQVTEVYLNWD